MTQQQLDEHPDAHRLFWRLVGLALGISAFLYGLGYIVNDNRYAVSPALAVLRHAHMRTVGAVMLVVGLWLVLEVLLVDDFPRHFASYAYCGVSVAISVCIVGSWWVTHKFTWSAPWPWLAFAVISGGMIRWPPPPKWKGGDGA